MFSAATSSGSRRCQLCLQHLPEEVVVTEPFPAVVERDDQQVVRLERLQNARGIVPLEHGVTQRTAHAVEDRGPRQELELARAPGGRGARPEVIGDEPVVAAERREPRLAVGSVESERREVDPCGPALGALVQRGRLRLAEVEPRRREELVSLGVAQRERRRSELEQLAVRPELREPEARLRAPGQHELRSGGHVEEKGRESVQAVGIVDLVDVVQHEHDRLTPSGERLAEPREAACPQGVARCIEPLEHLGRDRAVAVQGLGDVRHQEDRIVVAAVEGNPGELTSVMCRPLTERSGLAVAWRGDDAHEAAAAGAAEALDDRLSLYQPRPGWRDVELGREQLERPGWVRADRRHICRSTFDALRHRTYASGHFASVLAPSIPYGQQALQANVSVRLTSRLCQAG